MKSRLILSAFVVGVIVLTLPLTAGSHCQIPCGIYDDQLRFDLLTEHITTIEKGMDQILKLSAESKKNYNQLIRWTSNKDDHAGQFMEIITQYFMAQRIKPVDPGSTEEYVAYQKKVTLLHQMLVYAMKCKQTTDREQAAKLSFLLAEFHKLYFGDKK